MRSRVFAAAAGLLAMSFAGSAPADSPNAALLQDVGCNNGFSYDFRWPGSDLSRNPPAVFQLVPGPGNYSVHSVTIVPHDPTQPSFTIRNADGVANEQDLVQCTNHGHNNDFVFTGFFTPAS